MVASQSAIIFDTSIARFLRCFRRERHKNERVQIADDGFLQFTIELLLGIRRNGTFLVREREFK